MMMLVVSILLLLTAIWILNNLGLGFLISFLLVVLILISGGGGGGGRRW